MIHYASRIDEGSGPMTIVLNYTTKDSSQKQMKFKDNVEEIVVAFATTIDLSPLSSCKKLRELLLNFCNLKDVDLTPLDYSTKLENLQINGELKKIDLTPLGTCIKLKRLSLTHHDFQNVDLSPLSSCVNLQELELSSNPLQTVNLAPLSSCFSLRLLKMNNTYLESIDLSPLGSCKSLRELNLGSCYLQAIDLTPLESCSSLQKITLSSNQLHEIDLKPLSSCKNLTHLLLVRNPLQTADVTPLLNNPEKNDKNLPRVYIDEQIVAHSWLPDMEKGHRSLVYSRPTSQYPWHFLHEVAKNSPKDYRIQHDILAALGLGNYGFVDHDLTKIMRSISSKTATHEAQTLLADILSDKIVATVDRGGHTTGLNLEYLSGRHPEIEERTQEIIRLRASEIEQTTIGVDGDMFDLRALWLTAYGHEILSALDLRPITDSIGLEQVKKAFTDIGHEVHLSQSLAYGVDMSNKLKNCIWWIVENRGKLWSVIKRFWSRTT